MLNLLFAISGVSTGGVWALSGTALSPNNAITDQNSPTDAAAAWIFNIDGTIDRTQTAGTTQFQTSVEWDTDQPTPTTDIWIRATNEAGDNPTSGAALGSWHILNGSGEANRTFTWTETTDGFADTTGTLKVELSTDSGGSNIVATGYYRGSAIVLV